jgi:Fic-DOC domain mobile mystery protein B
MEYPKGATPLDPNELDGLKHKHITTRGELDELEQVNIETGLRWLGRQRADVLTDAFAITLHKRLFGDVWNWAGSFRRTGKNIGVDPIQIDVQLRQLMGDARYWAENLSAF